MGKLIQATDRISVNNLIKKMFSGKIKFSDDEDELFGNTPNSSSNLANIFGSSMVSPDSGNDSQSSLKYIPKKPTQIIDKQVDRSRGNESSASNNNENNVDWSIVVADVVVAYKLINNNNVPQGKIGLALLKSNEEPQFNFKIILYRTKSNILATTSLLTNKKVYLKHKYFQFEDDSGVFWSLFFENDSNRDKILEQIRTKCVVEYSNEEVLNNSDSSTKTTEEIVSIKKLETESALSDVNSVGDTQNKNTKADLLTRMAKMGQAVIPKLEMIPTTTSEVSESSDSESKSPPPSTKPLPPRKHHHHHSKPAVVVLPTNDASSNLVPYTNVVNHPVVTPSNSKIMIMPTAAQSTDHSMNVLLADNRTQNAEIRMNLMKLDSKIDRVLDRFDTINLRNNNNNRIDREDEILLLEEKLLELKKENRNLRIQIASKSECDDGALNRVKELDAVVAELQTKIKDYESSIQKKDQELEKLKETVDATFVKYHTEAETVIRLKDEMATKLKDSDEEQARKIKLIEELRIQLQDKEVELQKQLPLPDIPNKEEQPEKSVDTVVKEVINNLYHKLCDQFDGRNEFTQNEIVKIIGKTIKTETNNVLKKL